MSVTSDTLLNKMNESIEILQSAQRTVVEAKEEIKNAPIVAIEAKAMAQEAKEESASTKIIADAAQAKADGALPLTGGELTRNIKFKTNIDDSSNPEGASMYGIQVDWRYSGGEVLAGFLPAKTVSGEMKHIRTVEKAKENGSRYRSQISLGIDENGASYAPGPQPRANNYGPDLATMKTLKDYAPYVLPSGASMHLDANVGNDTADLFMGRGMSADKPFKTLDAALKFLGRCASREIHSLILHSDISITQVNAYLPCLAGVQIQSDSTKRKISIAANGNLRCLHGCLRMSNVIMQGANAHSLLYADGQTGTARIYIYHDVAFQGSAQEGGLVAKWDGQIVVANSITGTLDGPKYACKKAGRILVEGSSSIPGTQNGVADSGSVYA